MLSGEKLKFLRYSHGVSQVKMAEWCDITERFVGMVESNQYRPSKEVYDAWINCCYGIGKPLAKRENKKGVKKTTTKKTGE
ncbi:helix-turn-helix domain-containing protein [Konateibacter massiliensis]|uniref:helix-turn-helix domain-containing protein n=1 Tax=Konateibacter massiliensis TaxID=2002841 RepID=UPI000C15DD16|nr:helix-turn-helix transcriptional regulator [Konateibacter massiliensis]